jgi:hypothetical protein
MPGGRPVPESTESRHSGRAQPTATQQRRGQLSNAQLRATCIRCQQQAEHRIRRSVSSLPPSVCRFPLPLCCLPLRCRMRFGASPCTAARFVSLLFSAPFVAFCTVSVPNLPSRFPVRHIPPCRPAYEPHAECQHTEAEQGTRTLDAPQACGARVWPVRRSRRKSSRGMKLGTQIKPSCTSSVVALVCELGPWFLH